MLFLILFEWCNRQTPGSHGGLPFKRGDGQGNLLIRENSARPRGSRSIALGQDVMSFSGQLSEWTMATIPSARAPLSPVKLRRKTFPLGLPSTSHLSLLSLIGRQHVAPTVSETMSTPLTMLWFKKPRSPECMHGEQCGRYNWLGQSKKSRKKQTAAAEIIYSYL